LKAIGELVLQLVEGRLVTNAYDYNYPIGPSRPWEMVGEQWRQLCNRLLDPQLSLDQVNLESLEREFRPRLVTPRRIGVTVGIIVLVVAGVYTWTEVHKRKVARETTARQAREAEARGNFDKSMEAGNLLNGQSNYAQAMIEFQRAGTVAANLNDAVKKKTADESYSQANKLAQAGEEIAKTTGEKTAALDKAMAAGTTLLTQSNYAEARFEFEKA